MKQTTDGKKSNPKIDQIEVTENVLTSGAGLTLFVRYLRNIACLFHYKVVLRDPKSAGKLLPWVHRVISNAKAVIRGAHRGVSEKYLQSYLSEICYRFNRHFWERELFDRLIKACVSAETITYSGLQKTKFLYELSQ